MAALIEVPSEVWEGFIETSVAQRFRVANMLRFGNVTVRMRRNVRSQSELQQLSHRPGEGVVSAYDGWGAASVSSCIRTAAEQIVRQP